MKNWLTVSLVVLSLLSPAAIAATVVFSDSFDDGDVSDWVKSTNHAGPSQVDVRSDLFVSPGFALWTYLDAPPGGSNLTTTGTHEFVAPVSGNYELTLSAISTSCVGCTVSYEVFVDGIRLDRKSAPTSFESRLFSLPGLAAGSHTLGLGIHTDVAIAGRFNASFDDVVISTTALVPEPAAYVTMCIGLVVVFFLSVPKARRFST
jgi:hypothetical protein